MKSSRRQLFPLLLIILSTLACNTVMQVFETPAPAVPAATEALLLPSTETVPDLSEQEQLAIFSELWKIVDQEYLYQDFNGLDWDAVKGEVEAKIKAGMSSQEFYAAMQDIIYRLGDDHSDFLDPQAVAEEESEYAGEQDYAGIGIWVMAQPDDNRAVILMIFPDTPAEKAGLQAHDSILAVNGEPIVDPEGALVDTILGPVGTTVSITVQSPNQDSREMVIERARITGGLPVPHQVVQTPSGQSIGYILLPSFTDGSVDEQVADALREMAAETQLDGIIVDNRINSGGFSDVLEDTLKYFTGGVVGYFVNREGRKTLNIHQEDIAGSSRLPLVVMVGPDTISFGEVFAGVLQDIGRAYLIGMTTKGNVETLWGYTFDDGSRAWIAHDTFRPINDKTANWEQTGIIPDWQIAYNWAEFTFETDPVLQAALVYFDER